uniref:Uncharacterized protein n=1 Tax=Lotharella globosa TaxID=91324 RepID=A0A7S3Z628_9EUKA
MKLSSMIFPAFAALSALPSSSAFPAFARCGLHVQHTQLARVGNTRTITAQATVRNDGFFASSDVTISSSQLGGTTNLGVVGPFGGTQTFVKSFTLPEDVSCEKVSFRLKSDYCDETVAFPSMCLDGSEEKPTETESTHDAVDLLDASSDDEGLSYPSDLKRVNLGIKGDDPDAPRLTAAVILKEPTPDVPVEGWFSITFTDGTQSGMIPFEGTTDDSGKAKFIQRVHKPVKRFKIVVSNSDPQFVCKSQFDNQHLNNCFLRGSNNVLHFPDDVKVVHMSQGGDNPEKPRLVVGIVMKEAIPNVAVRGHFSVIFEDGTESGKVLVEGNTDSTGKAKFIHRVDKPVQRFKFAVTNSDPQFVCKSDFSSDNLGNCFLRGSNNSEML